MSFSASSAVAEERREYLYRASWRTALIAPRSRFRSGEQSIGYETILSRELTKAGSQLFLTIRHAGGTAQIARSTLTQRSRSRR